MTWFIHDVRHYGLRVALANVRFNLAYRLGGFTSARRDK